MAIPTSEIRKFKDATARAWVNGQPVTLTTLPTRTISALRGRSTCAVGVRDLPPSSGKPAQVDLVVNNNVARFFTGLTAERTAVAATVERTANLVDILDLNKAIPATITWSNTSFPDAVTSLLEAAGLTSAEIDSIFDPGADYTLGNVYPIELTPKENIGTAFRELMEFGGTATIVTPSGRVRVVDSPGIPAASSATVYAEGADLNTGELGIFDAGWQIEGDEGTVSVFTATGPRTPSGAQPDGTFTATGVSGKADGRSYRFAQSDAVCQAIAERELKRRARNKINAWYAAPLNPNLLPGDTVLLRTSRIGLATNTPAYVMEVASDGEAGMRVIVSLNPSLIDGYATSTPPPTADFSIAVEHQLVTLEGVPVASYLVQVRDESRDPTGAAITSRSWAASGPGASPTSSSEEAPIFLFASLEGTSIELTVESETGEAASVARTPRANTLQVLSRVVSVATSSGWRVLASTAGWRSWSAPGGASCTAVPPFNEVGPLWSGWSSGALYKSLDALATTPSLVHTFDGGIGCIFVNEGDPNDILVGHGSTLSRSQDGGATWEEIGDGDFEAVADVQSSPSNPNEIRVCAGDSAWISYDGGATWVAIIEWGASYDGSATAEALATAPWGHGVVFSAVGSLLEGAVLFEEGYTVDWSGVDLAELPADGLTSITPMLEEQAFVVGETKDLIRDGALAALVLSAGAGNLYKLSWTGSGFAASLLPPAAGSGAGKLITLAAHYPIDDASAAQIGYGPLSTQAIPPTTIVSNTAVLAQTLWTGSANSSRPTGWEWPGFDDSSWPDAVAANLDIYPEPIAGATAIWTSFNTLSATEQILTRQRVTLPAGVISSATLTVRLDDRGELYLNGTLIYTDVTYTPGAAGPVETVVVDPALLVAGGENVIAVWCRNDETLAHVSYKLEVA